MLEAVNGFLNVISVFMLLANAFRVHYRASRSQFLVPMNDALLATFVRYCSKLHIRRRCHPAKLAPTYN